MSNLLSVRAAVMATKWVLVAGTALCACQDLGHDAQPAPAPVSDSVKAHADQAPPIARVAKPAAVKALYLNAWTAGSRTKLGNLIAIADRTEINSFVVDVKEAGEISYASKVPLAQEIGSARDYIRDVSRLLDTLRAHNIYPIARIVVFKDPVLAKARPDFAVRSSDGSIWLDNKGKAWVDTYNRAVWDYNIALAREAADLGFSEVQWDYVRFSDAPKAYLNRAVYPAAAGRTKSDAVREFMLYSKTKLADKNIPVTADVFGLTVTTSGDMGIGQQWEKMANAVDVILPMVYPSHFIPGNYGLRNPNAAPYRTIQRSMEDAIRRSKLLPNAAAIRPWLQAFTLGPPHYTAAHVRAQIQAVYDAGLKEWVLWNSGSKYDAAAFALEGGAAPHFEVPGGKGAPRVRPPDDSVVKKPAPDSVVGDTIG